MLTDNKGLFDVLMSNKQTREVSLKMIDIFAARQSYHRREIDNVGLVRSERNLVDSSTKAQGDSALLDTMRYARLDHPVQEYYVLRPRAPARCHS